jgi:hypothetical protein
MQADTWRTLGLSSAAPKNNGGLKINTSLLSVVLHE